jgi:hypothetical protein
VRAGEPRGFSFMKSLKRKENRSEEIESCFDPLPCLILCLLESSETAYSQIPFWKGCVKLPIIRRLKGAEHPSPLEVTLPLLDLSYGNSNPPGCTLFLPRLLIMSMMAADCGSSPGRLREYRRRRGHAHSVLGGRRGRLFGRCVVASP